MKSKIALILAFTLALTAFAGCTNDEKNGGASSETPEVTVGEDGREMEGNMYLTGLPLVKEQETFSIFSDDGALAEDKIMYPILEEQTNVKVELMLYPYEAAIEKKNILLNGGDYPDVMGGWIFKEDDILSMGMGEQIFIPIEGLIEKYAPKMTEVLALEGVRDTMTLPDGSIYTIPYVIGAPLVAFNPWINTDWLKNVGKEVPTTTDELLDVLRAFKEQDANGNGDPNDEIPFSGDSHNGHLSALAGWFGVSADKYSLVPFSTMIDGELTFTANTDEYKDMIKFFAQLQTEGLLDPEYFTQDVTQWEAKGKTDAYGVSFAYGPENSYEGDPTKTLTGEPKTPFVPLPVLSSNNGKDPVFRRDSNGVATLKTQVVITDNAKNPATITRWWDNVFQFENSVQIQAGLIGKRIDKVSDTEYITLDENKLSDSDREKYDWVNMFTQSLPKFMPPEYKLTPPDGIPQPYDDGKVRDALYEPFLNETIPQVWSSADDAKAVSILQTDIVKYVEQKTAEWISGNSNVDDEWEDYKAQLQTLKVDEYIALKAKPMIEAQK